MGQKILLRLRPAWAPDTFYPEEDIIETMLHEVPYYSLTANNLTLNDPRSIAHTLCTWTARSNLLRFFVSSARRILRTQAHWICWRRLLHQWASTRRRYTPDRSRVDRTTTCNRTRRCREEEKGQYNPRHEWPSQVRRRTPRQPGTNAAGIGHPGA